MYTEADRIRPAEDWWRELEQDTETVSLTVRIPAPLRRYLDAAAKTEHIGVSDIVRWALLDYAIMNTTPHLVARREYLAALYQGQRSTEDDGIDALWDDQPELTEQVQKLVEFAREALRRPPALEGNLPEAGLRALIRDVVRDMRERGEL